MKICGVADCSKPVHARDLCDTHYARSRRHGDPVVGTRPYQRAGSVRIGVDGYAMKTGTGSVYLHRAVAEKALGHPLPDAAVVHHIDDDRTNGSPSNLVILEGHSHHAILHVRRWALRECGHPDWVRCKFCKQWCQPDTIYVRKGTQQGWHRECVNARMREYLKRRKA
jgi:hypothetical protein